MPLHGSYGIVKINNINKFVSLEKNIKKQHKSFKMTLSATGFLHEHMARRLAQLQFCRQLASARLELSFAPGDVSSKHGRRDMHHEVILVGEWRDPEIMVHYFTSFSLLSYTSPVPINPSF